MALSLIGSVHVAAASASLVTGAAQFLRSRRDAVHRRIGYAYVVAMLINNGTALLVYDFTGSFNIFHALAIYSFISVLLAVRPMLARPRPWQWRRIHYMWVAWSYVGLSGAAATEFLVRVAGVSGWLAAVAGSIPTFAVGWWLVERSKPPLRAAAPTPSEATS